MSKGSRDRVTDKKKFDENYEQINWSVGRTNAHWRGRVSAADMVAKAVARTLEKYPGPIDMSGYAVFMGEVTPEGR